MEKKNKIILVVLFLIIIIAFIYGYSCNTFILGGGQINNNINPTYQCYLNMKEGTVCPDCTTKMIGGNILSCPTVPGIKMCNKGNLND
jgi:hypothetical protein